MQGNDIKWGVLKVLLHEVLHEKPRHLLINQGRGVGGWFESDWS